MAMAMENASLGATANKSNLILSLYLNNGNLAASYYNVDEKLLYMYKEIEDPEPQFEITRSLIRELQPSHVITVSGVPDAFIVLLKSILNQDDNQNDTMGPNARPNTNLSVLPFKEYSFHGCMYSLKNLHLLSEPKDITPEERTIYLQAFINFGSTLIINSLGSLVRFIDRSWMYIKGHDDQDPSPVFLHLKQLTLSDSVYINDLTFKGLQVFQRTNHDSNFKHGGDSSTREGTSLFRLLSQYTVSKGGYIATRKLLLNPTRNEEELQSRLQFIEFVNDIRNSTLIDNIVENLKKISDINVVLQRIIASKASADQWDTLHKTIFHTLYINELCANYTNHCKVFGKLAESVSPNLYEIYIGIDSTLDFSVQRLRPNVKEGIDSDLDEAKMKSEDMKNRITAAAKTVVNELPPLLQQCTVFFVPDMGHVLGLRKWADSCDPNELEEYGYHFVFQMNDQYYYKNALCKEMDIQLGDLPSEILHHENRVIERMAAFILRDNETIRKPLENLALIDALISFAKVSGSRGYVKPKFNRENVYEIEEGRHPIMEITDPNFVANDFYSGGPHSHMKIITGPNASGKSVYLKQITMLIYMAHVGCFVPAKRAHISLAYSIYARIHATESAAVSLSAFMIDLAQMSQALYNSKANSVILMDEFGRGTTGRESKALLLGALRHFLKRGEDCPHVIISTHMRLEKSFLPSPMALYQKMAHERNSNEELMFLYKVVEGESQSFAIEMAQQFDASILARARHILNNSDKLEPLEQVRNQIPNNGEIAIISGLPVRIPPFDD